MSRVRVRDARRPAIDVQDVTIPACHSEEVRAFADPIVATFAAWTVRFGASASVQPCPACSLEAWAIQMDEDPRAPAIAADMRTWLRGTPE